MGIERPPIMAVFLFKPSELNIAHNTDDQKLKHTGHVNGLDKPFPNIL